MHALGRWVVSRPDTQVFGFQMLVEASTGVRTSEALALRFDAKYGEPGFIDALKELLKAHSAWHERRFKDSP